MEGQCGEMYAVLGAGGRYLDDQGVLGPQGVRGLERQGAWSRRPRELQLQVRG